MPVELTEYQLRDYLCCPLSFLIEIRDRLYQPVYDVVCASIQERPLLAHRVSREELRNRLEKTCAHLDPDWIRVIRIAARLDELLRDFEILSDPMPYAVTVAEATITGEYMLVRRFGRRKDISVLRLRGLREEFQRCGQRQPCRPDILDCLRLYHLHQTNHLSCSVLNYWITSERHSYTTVDPGQAGEAILAAYAHYAAQQRFPSPGYHCRACRRPDCFACTPHKPAEPAAWHGEPASGESAFEDLLAHAAAASPALFSRLPAFCRPAMPKSEADGDA